MEDQSTYEAQQEVTQLEDCSSTASQSQQSEQQHDPSPSSDTPSSFSSAVTDSSSSPACEDAGAEEESVRVAASHRDAAPEPESPMDAAQTGNVEAQPPQTETIGPGVVMEGTGDTVDTGQDVVKAVPHAKQEDGGGIEEALKLEEGGEDHEPQEQEIPENTTELELEENGNGVELLDIMNVSMLDDMAKRIQVEEVRFFSRFSSNSNDKEAYVLFCAWHGFVLRIRMISNQIRFKGLSNLAFEHFAKLLLILRLEMFNILHILCIVCKFG